MTLLHQTHPGQFGIKDPAKNIWWPHLYREIYHHGKNCVQCIKADKKLKIFLGATNTQKLRDLSEPNGEMDLDFAGPLDKNWETSKYLLFCLDRFT